MVEPQSQIQTTGITYEGHPVLLKDIPESDLRMPAASAASEIDTRVLHHKAPRPKNFDLDSGVKNENGEYEEVDYQDFIQVNFQMLALNRKLHSIREDLRTAERSVIKKRQAYTQGLRRELIRTVGGSEKVRTAWAEMKVEEEEKELQVAIQIVKELQQLSKDIRIEFDILKEIGNNLRRSNDFESRQ